MPCTERVGRPDRSLKLTTHQRQTYFRQPANKLHPVRALR
jgi:hypothetical protein